MTHKQILEKLLRANGTDAVTKLIQDAVNEAKDRCDIINALDELARQFSATSKLIEDESFWGDDAEQIEPESNWRKGIGDRWVRNDGRFHIEKIGDVFRIFRGRTVGMGLQVIPEVKFLDAETAQQFGDSLT